MYPKQNKQVAANIITAIIRITLLCNHKSVKTNKIDTNNCKMKTPRNIPETYSDLLEKPDLSVKTALKSIFRKSQVRTISEKFGLNLNAQIVCLSPSQWLNCFLEMLEVVPEKFHPS